MNASEGELLRNQPQPKLAVALIVRETVDAWRKVAVHNLDLYDENGPSMPEAVADALLARFDVRLRVPQEEPFVVLTAMADDAKLVLHKVRIQGRLRVDGEKFADGSGITDCFFDSDVHPSDVLPGVPFVEISSARSPRVPQEEEQPEPVLEERNFDTFLAHDVVAPGAPRYIAPGPAAE